ncbi:VOC family protein [Thiomicrorhabdus heinhorstiae]|uniref:VOC family protein n=1 Tax=Thiomicrorhabdus heinhorstiae TaxID=2748010 RepID=A0ABS0BUN2_9GAMM|nr:VOC family protein [Thiomicrorhabdus heinhorstiae]MBF6056810.1 VOC family protein [Thiomicrorhabdus heinhorstiae]
MSKVLGLDHVSVLVADADRALDFYQDILQVSLLQRPELAFPGYWLDLGGGQSVHLMQLSNPYATIEKPQHGGRDQHLALRVSSIEEFADRLTTKGIAFTRSKSGRQALFFRDLDQNAIELFEYRN